MTNCSWLIVDIYHCSEPVTHALASRCGGAYFHILANKMGSYTFTHEGCREKM